MPVKEQRSPVKELQPPVKERQPPVHHPTGVAFSVTDKPSALCMPTDRSGTCELAKDRTLAKRDIGPHSSSGHSARESKPAPGDTQAPCGGPPPSPAVLLSGENPYTAVESHGRNASFPASYRSVETVCRVDRSGREPVRPEIRKRDIEARGSRGSIYPLTVVGGGWASPLF